MKNKSLLLFVIVWALTESVLAQSTDTTKQQNKFNYDKVDFSYIENMDSDEDGIIHFDDACPNTPKGIRVYGNGCPLDDDDDGVPDYRDKEKLTKKNSPVDKFGVTITDQMLSDMQYQFDSVASKRSELFNANPSIDFLNNNKAKTIEAPKTTNEIITIPNSLQAADENKDSFISEDEIKAAIDAFFDGDSNYSVEKLNNLIDYFFQQ